MGFKKYSTAGIVLAAGASTRMGRTKQLLPINGETNLLEMILSETLKSDLHKVCLVLGHKAKEIRDVLGQRLQHSKLEVVWNRQYELGLSSSIISGLSQMEKAYDHVMVILADMPYIDARLINLLLRRYQDSGMPMGAVGINKRRSHPVIFSRKIYHELHDLRGDVGAKDLLMKYRDKVCMVDPEGFYNDIDIDTPEDYLLFRNSPAKR